MLRRRDDERAETWLVIAGPLLAVSLLLSLAMSEASSLPFGVGGDQGPSVDLSAIAFAPPFDGKPARRNVLEGGIVVEDFETGEGDEVVKGDRVQIHYTGYLLDGTVFDSSIPRGQPIGVPIGAGRVIQGWDRGVPGMKKGGKRRLVIPSDLAYGPAARGKIPANAVLVFTLEMVSFERGGHR